MRFILFVFILITAACSVAKNQTGGYADSIQEFRKTYTETHELVSAEDRSSFDFFPANENFRVTARFTPVRNGKWFSMKTSGNTDKIFRTFGKIHFTINGDSLQLTIYQSQSLLQSEEFRDHLFLPFMDLTTGETTYESGRYIDLYLNDIQNNLVVIDFNKAYNPYCVYASGYNCPIPPNENFLNFPITAGEKKFKTQN